MFGWLTRALTPPEAIKPRVSARLTELENEVDDINSRLEYLAKELKSVRGRQFALEKVRQDDVGEEISEAPAPDDRPRYPQPPSTEHLARRFRGW
jgi:hypothetical protein